MPHNNNVCMRFVIGFSCVLLFMGTVSCGCKRSSVARAPVRGAVQTTVPTNRTTGNTASRTAPASASPTSSTNNVQVVYLRPGLTLNITVLVAGKKEIEEHMRRISDNGMIEMPLLGAVNVEGVAAAKLPGMLAKLYRQYYVDPQVIVDFAKDDKTDGVSPWGFVTVLGRVKSPGRVEIPPTSDLTVSGAIQRAGGFDKSARLKAIRVTQKAADGKTETREIDMEAIGTRGQIKEDIVLQPDSVVYVPEQVF
jgi:protein involved in polysaccharide export with SLBB domain